MTEGNGSTKKPLTREPLVAPRLKQAEFACTTYRAFPERGTTLDEIKEPKYWSHVASKLRQYDEIVAIEEAGAWRAELLVTACDRNWATVHVVKFDELRTPELPADATPADEFKVEHAGPHHMWRVVRKSDNKILFKGGQDRAAAETFLSEHRKTVYKTA